MTTAHETYTSPTDYLTQRLRRELKELDEHEKETRRLLDAAAGGATMPCGAFDGRSDRHLDLQCRVINSARALAVVLP